MTNKNIYSVALIIILLTGCQARKSNPEAFNSAIPVTTESAKIIETGKRFH